MILRMVIIYFFRLKRYMFYLDVQFYPGINNKTKFLIKEIKTKITLFCQILFFLKNYLKDRDQKIKEDSLKVFCE